MNEADVCYGDLVRLCSEEVGIVQYIGSVSAGDPLLGVNRIGVYYGIALQYNAAGSHNGTVRGRLYFQCQSKHGLFVRLSEIEAVLHQNTDPSTRYHINQKVLIRSRRQIGSIRYIGLCQRLHNPADALWFGVELNRFQSLNKFPQSNGTIQNISYFECRENCIGLFVQRCNISTPSPPFIVRHPSNKKTLEAVVAAAPPPPQYSPPTISSVHHSKPPAPPPRQPPPAFAVHLSSLRNSNINEGSDIHRDASHGSTNRSSHCSTNRSQKSYYSHSHSRAQSSSHTHHQSHHKKPSAHGHCCDKCKHHHHHHKHRHRHKHHHHHQKARESKAPPKTITPAANAINNERFRTRSHQSLPKPPPKANAENNIVQTQTQTQMQTTVDSSSNKRTRKPYKPRHSAHTFAATKYQQRSHSFKQAAVTHTLSASNLAPLQQAPSYNTSASDTTDSSADSAPSPSAFHTAALKRPAPSFVQQRHMQLNNSDHTLRNLPPPQRRTAALSKSSSHANVVPQLSQQQQTKTNSQQDKKKKLNSSLVDRAKSMMSALQLSTSSEVSYAAHCHAELGTSTVVDKQLLWQFKQNQPHKKGENERRSKQWNKRRSLQLRASKSSDNKKLDCSSQRAASARDIPHRKHKSLGVLRNNANNNVNVNKNSNRYSSNDDEYEFGSTSTESSILSDSESAVVDSKCSDQDDDGDNSEEEALSLLVSSWNVGENEFNLDDESMYRWLGSNTSQRYRMHDIYVIGLQECVGQHRRAWTNGILQYLDGGTKQFVLVHKIHLMNILMLVIVNRLYESRIRVIRCKTVACGKGNIIGNKGAVAVSLKFDESTFVFVNAHLVARAERYMQRMENIQRIFKMLDSANMGPMHNMDVLNQFQHVIFFGDLNYRIMKDFRTVCQLMKNAEFARFAHCDQLNEQMCTYEILYKFKEGDISMFAPTYRWERHKNVISNKREQAPSYTDRVLFKSLPNCHSLWLTKYKSCMKCYGSDHRPIVSTFKFVPNVLPRTHSRKSKKLKKIQIMLRGFKLVLNSNAKKLRNVEVNESDEICCNLYYAYSDNPREAHKLCGGYFDAQQKCFAFNFETLNAVKIIPFVLNPEFIAMTYIYVQIVNASRSNSVIGYSTISLLNVFPSNLVNRNKMRQKYKFQSHSDAALQPQQPQASRKHFDDVMGTEFDSPITIFGTYIGDILACIHAQSELLPKYQK